MIDGNELSVSFLIVPPQEETLDSAGNGDGSRLINEEAIRC
jgi:hypothetical protein